MFSFNSIFHRCLGAWLAFFFLLFTSASALAGKGVNPQQPYSQPNTEQTARGASVQHGHEQQGGEHHDRFILLKRAITVAAYKICKIGERLKQGTEQLELYVWECADSTSRDMLDLVGDLGEHFFCCLGVSLHRPPPPVVSDHIPMKSRCTMTVDMEPPPGYQETPATDTKAEESIRNEILHAYAELHQLGAVGYFSLVERRVMQVLAMYPDYQGSDYVHSGLLYMIQRQVYLCQHKYQDALDSVYREQGALSTEFIKKHDPQMFIDYADLLVKSGDQEGAHEVMRACQEKQTRPYLRRQAALWYARFYCKNGQLEEAESAYIEALIVLHHDPFPYLEYIRFLARKGEWETAKALTGVMRRAMFKSGPWEHYKQQQMALCSSLPKELRDYAGSKNDVKVALCYWISKGRLDETAPYWTSLLENYTKGGCSGYGEKIPNELKEIVLQIPSNLGMSAADRMQYFEALYRFQFCWIRDGFYTDVYVRAVMSTLTAENDQEGTLAFARSVMAIDKKNGKLEREHPSLDAMIMAVKAYIECKNYNAANSVFIHLLRVYSWDNTSKTLSHFMAQLACHMSREQSFQALKAMLHNFRWIYSEIPEMIASLEQTHGAKTVAEGLTVALSSERKAVSKASSMDLKWLLENTFPLDAPDSRNEELLFAWCSHPTVNQVWTDILWRHHQATQRSPIYESLDELRQEKKETARLFENRPIQRKRRTDTKGSAYKANSVVSKPHRKHLFFSGMVR